MLSMSGNGHGYMSMTETTMPIDVDPATRPLAVSGELCPRVSADASATGTMIVMPRLMRNPGEG